MSPAEAVEGENRLWVQQLDVNWTDEHGVGCRNTLALGAVVSRLPANPQTSAGI